MSKPLERFFLKPGPWGSVRDPKTRAMLANEGEWKPMSIYWRRRVKMQDVVIAKPPVAEKIKKPVAAKPETKPKKAPVSMVQEESNKKKKGDS